MRSWHIASAVARASAASLVVAAATLLIAVPTSSAQSQDVRGVKGATIRVMICPVAGQSSMTITSPASDTVVANASVSITGNVMSISQVEVSVDGIYDSTVAIPGGATQFETQVSLEPGTHTVSLLAYDSCAQETHQDSFVTSYSPVFVPAAGRDAETIVAAGTLFGAPSASPAAAVTAVQQPVGVPAALPEFVQKVFRELGWTVTEDAGNNSLNIGKSFSALTAITVLMFAATLSIASGSGMLEKSWPHGRKLKPVRHVLQQIQHSIRAVWAIGIILLILPFLV